MVAIFDAIHVLICVALIIVVLLQTGKGVGLASVFGSPGGGGGADSLFGSKGFGGMLAKATGVLAVAFMISSITLTLIPRGGTASQESVLDRLEGPSQGVPTEQTQPAPVQTPPGGAAEETQPPSEEPPQSPSGE
jgi:preprotein translocase subunit SecG